MHEEWTDRLSAYLDDELDPATRRDVAAHLAACGSCATTLEELRAVVSRAARAVRDDETQPAAAGLWHAIAARIERPAPAPLPGTFSRRFSFTLPQLAAAALALMTASGAAVWVVQHGGPATSLPPIGAAAPDARVVTPAAFNDPHFDEAVNDLQRALDAQRGRLDARTVEILESNLAAIDRAIDQSRRALAADPANAYLNRHLADARRRKLALLRTAAALAGPKG